MPSADAGNLFFVGTVVLNRLGEATPDMTISLVLCSFCRGPGLLCLSLHVTHKAVGSQLSLTEGLERCKGVHAQISWATTCITR